MHSGGGAVRSEAEGHAAYEAADRGTRRTVRRHSRARADPRQTIAILDGRTALSRPKRPHLPGALGCAAFRKKKGLFALPIPRMPCIVLTAVAMLKGGVA